MYYSRTFIGRVTNQKILCGDMHMEYDDTHTLLMNIKVFQSLEQFRKSDIWYLTIWTW